MISTAMRPSKQMYSGGAFRIAPARGGEPAAQFWKFCVSGSEVYALARGSGNTAKISVHASGQIHFRLEGKHLQEMAPPLILGNGQWQHAFELRFLLGPDVFRPPQEKFKNKRAFLIDVPVDRVLIMNLLIGRAGSSVAPALPPELLPAAQPVWTASLRDQRPVVLAARNLEMDQKNRDEIRSIRYEINPKVNFKAAPKNPYVEVRRIIWNATGGNVILVVPMGKEGIRIEGEPSSSSRPSKVAAPVRTIQFAHPSASFPIAAPNGAIVAVLSIEGATKELELIKDKEVQRSVGTVHLSLNPQNLLTGSSFQTAPIRHYCPPTIDGAQPRNWEYSVFGYFDGSTFRVEIRAISTALWNANFLVPIPNLEDTEELVMHMPLGGLTLRVTHLAPNASAALDGGFLLRNI